MTNNSTHGQIYTLNPVGALAEQAAAMAEESGLLKELLQYSFDNGILLILSTRGAV